MTLTASLYGLSYELVALEQAWSELEISGLRRVARELRQHVGAVLPFLEPPVGKPPAFTRLSDCERVVTHVAYLTIVEIGQLVRSAAQDGRAPGHATDRAMVAVRALLDELTPFVSRADDALRRVLLDDEPLDAAVARIRAADVC